MPPPWRPTNTHRSSNGAAAGRPRREWRRLREVAMPKISVGLPVRNGAAYLQEAIDGILAQTYQDFELIISDNGSKERPAGIRADTGPRERGVRFFRQSSGLPPAENHNFVLHRAKAEFFKWNCHDDTCAPQFLERCLAALH